jgi:hypothetical protein
MLRALTVLGALLLGQTSASATCAAEPWWISYWGAHSSTSMLVSSGEPCNLAASTGGTNIIESVAISSPARSGTASVDGSNTVWYQSQPGFAGDDTFAFVVTGSGRGGTGSSTVQVSVTVR